MATVVVGVGVGDGEGAGAVEVSPSVSPEDPDPHAAQSAADPSSAPANFFFALLATRPPSFDLVSASYRTIPNFSLTALVNRVRPIAHTFAR